MQPVYVFIVVDVDHAVRPPFVVLGALLVEGIAESVGHPGDDGVATHSSDNLLSDRSNSVTCRVSG